MKFYEFFSDIYLRSRWPGLHFIFLRAHWMGWRSLRESMPGQTLFILRGFIHDCRNRRHHKPQHCSDGGKFEKENREIIINCCVIFTRKSMTTLKKGK